MNPIIDFFIDSENDLASFEYYFEEDLNIKSVTLKSIMFYNAYVDLKKGITYYRTDIGYEVEQTLHYPIKDQKEFNLNYFCDFLNIRELIAVKFHNDKNHLIIELLKDVECVLSDYDPNPHPDYVTFRDLFGFVPTYTWKGKYTSPKSIIDTPPILYLRSNLVDKQNTFYNNKYSDILYYLHVDIDKDAQHMNHQIVLKTYTNVLYI